MSDFKPASASHTVMTELMIPSYANFSGKIHGGIVLSLMDKVAYACASKHARGYCVTVSVDTVDFREPIEVGELLSLHASVNYVGRSSMVVGIRVTAEDVSKGVVRHTNTSYFTMVAKGEDNQPREVPGLLLETEEELRRYIEAIKRIELKEHYRDAFDNERSGLNLDAQLHLLEGRRCQLAEGLFGQEGRRTDK
ncbi:MAG: acyl-CoA thioesterase [Bacteroidia bacterium]|nr:acyl-CoA thioesterase [Bacteroidia bacterium]